MNKIYGLRWIVLVAGPLMAAVFTLIPLLASIGTDEFITELFTGSGLGWLVASAPYVLFWFISRKPLRQKLVLTTGAVVLASGLIGLTMMIMAQDPQTAIAYALYVLPVQYFAVLILSFSPKTTE